jgi:hypothetical protein
LLGKMQSLPRDQFLSILRLTSGTFDQLQYAGHVALAFETPLPARPGWYLDLDLVAMAINLGLTPSFGRDYATAIVGGYFNQWGAAVGHAEADRSQSFFMAIGGRDWDPAKKRPRLLLVTHGTLAQIAEDFRQIGGLVGAYHVNVTDIIARLRARAREIGVDLSSPFFFAPDDPRLNDVLRQVEQERDARIARFRRDKRKLGAIVARRRSKDIEVVPRVRAIEYPFAVGGRG